MDAEDKPKKKNGVPANFKRKGKPRALSADQHLFCAKRAMGISVQGSCAEVGVSFGAGWKWNRMPTIEKQIEANREKIAQRLFDQEFQSYTLNLQHADVEVTRVASMQKPHKFRGFSDKTHAIELIYRRLKAIAPKTTVNATAVAGVVQGATVKERYKALWLIQKEESLAQQFERESADKNLPAAPTP